MNGVCSPACAVRFEQRMDEIVTRLGDFAIDRFEHGAPAGYPTLCKGRYLVRGEPLYLFEEPTSLSALSLLPRLRDAGVTAVKIEGRQRGKAYITKVVASFRRALDALANGSVTPESDLHGVAEGGRQTAGAFQKAWR